MLIAERAEMLKAERAEASTSEVSLAKDASSVRFLGRRSDLRVKLVEGGSSKVSLLSLSVMLDLLFCFNFDFDFDRILLLLLLRPFFLDSSPSSDTLRRRLFSGTLCSSKNTSRL